MVGGFGFAINKANVEGENGGIPAQINELKATVYDLTKQVADLLPLKEDVKSIKDQVVSSNGTFSEQQKDIDLIKQQIEDIKKEVEEIKTSSVTATSNEQQVQQRLSFQDANYRVVATLSDSSLRVPNKVLYLWEENNPEDKLVGITDYNGNVTFNVIKGKKYVVEFKGDDKYKPTYANPYWPPGPYDVANLQTFSW